MNDLIYITMHAPYHVVFGNACLSHSNVWMIHKLLKDQEMHFGYMN